MNEMFYAIRLPAVKGEMLDQFLAKGWYRYGSSVFTTNFIEHNEAKYPVHWIRYDMPNIKFTSKQKELFRRNKKFDVQIESFSYSESLEQLHDLYVDQIDFLTGPSLASILEDVDCCVFESKLIKVFDEKKLIGVGVFDVGKNSIAGIKNYFHPDYKKYSLGKYLVLLKAKYCLQNNIKWYYPGYIAPGYAKFDYKLFLNKPLTEIYSIEKDEWTSFFENELSLFYSNSE
jgi:arginine-tRNA-protein transferase